MVEKWKAPFTNINKKSHQTTKNVAKQSLLLDSENISLNKAELENVNVSDLDVKS